MPLVGDTILHYEILSHLGKGAMGQVFKALDTKLDREVALKFLLNQGQLDEGQKERLIIEARAVAKLDHPHVGSLYAIEEHEDELFLAMALYEGESLDETLSQGALAVEKALALAKQILEGLAHAHEQGVIHLDIKPANIFVTTKGVVKILDFGLARLPDSELTQQGQMMGTPSYASPEQLRNDNVDQRTDIWSLGVMLFRLLTGELPFEGMYPRVMLAILKEEPTPLDQFMDHQALKLIIERCLAKDQNERFQSCQDILETLAGLDPVTDVASTPKVTHVPQERSVQRRTPNLIGREREVEEVVSLLVDEDTYLLTITAMGGAGKTSLARTVMADPRLLPSYPDGIHFVPLDALQDARQIPFEIATVLGLQLEGQDTWLELAQSMQTTTSLLVLDNLEHIIEDCAVELEELLTACPNLTILATSREVLNVEGEVVYELKGLALPPNLEADFDNYGAAELFILKAKRLKRSFDADAEKEHILAICRQLEGWPLGIELAVAWIRQLSAGEIAEQIEQSLDLLTTRSRSQTSRHQSARAAFDYSWQLLTPLEQASLVKLSCFRGGFSTKAATNVTQTKLSTLASLIDKSLLSMSEQGRYDRHPLIHQFSQEKLLASEDAERVFAGHADYFLALAEEAKPHLSGEEQASWLGTLAAEHDNLLAALGHYEAQQDIAKALSLGVAMGNFWNVRGHYQLGEAWLRRLREQLPAGSDTKLLAKALTQEGLLVQHQGKLREAEALFVECLALDEGNQRGMALSLHNLGDNARQQGHYEEAKAFFERSLMLRREFNDQRGITASLDQLGWMASEKGDYLEAEELLNEALSLRRELNDQRGIAASLNALGTIAIYQGDDGKAEALYQQSLSLARELNTLRGIASALGNLGLIAYNQGRYHEAHTLFQEGLTLLREIGDQISIAIALNNLGNIARNQGDEMQAKALYQESLVLSQEAGDQAGVAYVLGDIALLLSNSEQYHASVKLFAACQAYASQLSLSLDPQIMTEHQQGVDRLRETIGSRHFDELWQAGLEQSVDEAVTLALTELNTSV